LTNWTRINTMVRASRPMQRRARRSK
jgi:hypothetical protein